MELNLGLDLCYGISCSLTCKKRTKTKYIPQKLDFYKLPVLHLLHFKLMSSERPDSRGFDPAVTTPATGNQPTKPEKNPSSKAAAATAASSNVGKALAHRAVYGAQKRWTGRRRNPVHGVRLLPSRLSKVSLADNSSPSDSNF